MFEQSLNVFRPRPPDNDRKSSDLVLALFAQTLIRGSHVDIAWAATRVFENPLEIVVQTDAGVFLEIEVIDLLSMRIVKRPKSIERIYIISSD